MKRSLLLTIMAVVSLPVAALANHLDGTWGGWSRNGLQFSVGGHHHRFSHHGDVQFVDDHGAAVNYHTLRAGHPITVHYSGRRGHEIVRRVVVHRRTHHHHRGH